LRRRGSRAELTGRSDAYKLSVNDFVVRAVALGCILAGGAGEQKPVVKDGALAIATAMTCTLSVDHRVVDGAVGAEFLAAFKRLIEDPLTMLL
jgi:acetylornithine deacetylase/succinyl-diaminopimelate desuccinylase-like protein